MLLGLLRDAIASYRVVEVVGGEPQALQLLVGRVRGLVRGKVDVNLKKRVCKR